MSEFTVSLLYKSTRGSEKKVSAAEAILQGIAEDGGLFVPEAIPTLDKSLTDLVSLSYKELAFTILSKFLTDFTEAELKSCIDKAYNDKFDTTEIAPLKKAGDVYFLELFHGPTLAFKDMALSILPLLLTTSAVKLKEEKKIVILTATSGDTGSAALEGFANIDNLEIIVFFPEIGVSEVQKKQMTTQSGKNTHVISIKGNFDDAQSGVKKIFTDEELAKYLEENNVMLSSANSINIGRLVPQVVYYFHAYLELLKKGAITAGEEINVVVPTGNFGNILAGYYAKQMGLPIGKFLCASNDNKVLYDFFKTGIYNKDRDFAITISPSMDILISSNLERLIFAVSGNDSAKTKGLMDELNKSGSYEITEAMKTNLADFFGGFATEVQTKEAIKEAYNNASYVMDTHTAVAYSVYTDYVKATADNTKTVIVSTASPYKFAPAVMSSIDAKYEGKGDFELIPLLSEISKTDIPVPVKGLDDKLVHHKTVCTKEEMKNIVLENLGLLKM